MDHCCHGNEENKEIHKNGYNSASMEIAENLVQNREFSKSGNFVMLLKFSPHQPLLLCYPKCDTRLAITRPI